MYVNGGSGHGEESECFRGHQRAESKETKRKKLLLEVRDCEAGGVSFHGSDLGEF